MRSRFSVGVYKSSKALVVVQVQGFALCPSSASKLGDDDSNEIRKYACLANDIGKGKMSSTWWLRSVIGGVNQAYKPALGQLEAGRLGLRKCQVQVRQHMTCHGSIRPVPGSHSEP